MQVKSCYAAPLSKMRITDINVTFNVGIIATRMQMDGIYI